LCQSQEGQHNDLFELQTLFEEICTFLRQAGIDVKGLFLDADAGFDSKEFRAICQQKEIIANILHNSRNEKEVESTNYQYFDEALYKRRYVIERANAWQDQFKALIIRYETRVDTWLSLLILSFTVIFIRRINKKINPKQPPYDINFFQPKTFRKAQAKPKKRKRLS